ncbi:MAG: Smr/MutS family protein, partial [Acidobacteriota bacterium]
EDAATARKVKKEVERRTVELKVAAGSAARQLRQQQGILTAEEHAAIEAETAVPEITDFEIGDRVRVLSLSQEGVVEAIKGEEIVVQVGALRFREQADNLRFIERKAASQKAAKAVAGLPKGVSVSLQEQKSVSSELNVIGKTTNEATYEADKFLDAAYLDNHDRIRIVHGMGMGALKRAIADLLSGHPHVAKFYPAEQSEGGNGATIVELKK